VKTLTRTRFAALAAAALLAGAGCANIDPQEERAGDTVENFFDGLARADGGQACGALSRPVVRDLAEQAQVLGPEAGCPEVIEAVAAQFGPEQRDALERADATNVRVTGDRAIVEYRIQGTDETQQAPFELREVNGQWVITQLDAGGDGES